MHLPGLIKDLAIILLTGGIVTVIFKKLNQPLVLGYILAGFLVGPYVTLYWGITDGVSVETWSEIGIIILMFSLGLEFNIHKLISVGGTAIITALVEIAGMMLLGYSVGQAMNMGKMDSIFLGGMLSMSSTTIIIKAFDDLGVTKEKFAELVFGTLVIEDIAGIFMMIILSTISVGQNVEGAELAVKLVKLVLYLAVWLICGIFLLPTFLHKIENIMTDEILLVFSLGLCFGMVLLANALGFSSALGAFLAGSLLAGTTLAERIEHLSKGVKDLFGAIFFISVGMMVNPSVILERWVLVLILTLVTLTGKMFFSSFGVMLSGQNLKTSVRCGSSLAQIGEFAFIIAALGIQLGVIQDYIYPVIITVSVITTLTTPATIKNADRISNFLCKILPKSLIERINRYSADEVQEQYSDSNWMLYLRRYVKKTSVFGIIMLGITIIGRKLLYPALTKIVPNETACVWITIAVVLVGIAVFIKPMLDLKAPEYMMLWMNRKNRLPLTALNTLRYSIIAAIIFLPLMQIANIRSIWFLPAIAAGIFGASKMRILSSLYLNVEARFLANFNERQLHRTFEDGTKWVDDTLYVMEFKAPEKSENKTLRELNWGSKWNVNVFKIKRGWQHINMPSGYESVKQKDQLYVIGESESLNIMKAALGIKEKHMVTLHEFVKNEHDPDTDLFTYAIKVDRGSSLDGVSIRDSNLRDEYDCMIIGIQRLKLPIVQPEVNLIIQSGDVVWLMGAKSMMQKLLDSEEKLGLI